jgi:maleate isomerase
VAIAQVQEEDLRRHVAEMDGDDVDAFVQVGTNLSMCALCVDLEKEYGKPFVAINAATYWHALRAMNITDRTEGHGWLFERH